MVNYGDLVMLQNGYNNWSGGFLDTCGHASCGTDLYNVLTAPSGPSPRGAGTNTAQWKILDASGKASGQAVRYGDQIQLQNGYSNWSGGFLDTCGHASCGTDLYVVLTAPSAPTPRAGSPNTALWKILDASGNATGQVVNPGDSVVLQNGYNNWGGGFLDTCGHASCGTDLYGVSTAPSAPTPRTGGTNTALWRILR